jgi:HAD superfamily hydrolase (TIGR01509 family)
MAQRAFDLVIFDCDGVLVDSEMLSAGVLMAMMAEVGFPITESEFRADFLGRSFANAAARAETRYGQPLPDDFQLLYRERLLARMRQDLKPMAGVFAVLDHIAVPYCLATSSSPQRLAVSLEVTGLARYFQGRSYTASEVEHGKPAPDLPFHAARAMNVVPHRCLVIEDSEMGIRAAQAAGMACWQFHGGAHCKAGYVLPRDVKPARRTADMADLHSAFRSLALCD